MRLEVGKSPTGNEIVTNEWSSILFTSAQLSLNQNGKSGKCSRFLHPGFSVFQTRSFYPDAERKANPHFSDCFYLKCLYPADVSVWADSSVIQPSRALLSAPSIKKNGTKTQISQSIRPLDSSSHANSYSFLSISLIYPSRPPFCQSLSLLSLILNEIVSHLYSL